MTRYSEMTEAKIDGTVVGRLRKVTRIVGAGQGESVMWRAFLLNGTKVGEFSRRVDAIDALRSHE